MTDRKMQGFNSLLGGETNNNANTITPSDTTQLLPSNNFEDERMVFGRRRSPTHSPKQKPEQGRLYDFLADASQTDGDDHHQNSMDSALFEMEDFTGEDQSDIGIHSDPHPGQTSSVLSAVLNFTNSIVGAGIIGLPFALLESGFWSGIVLIILLAIVVYWTISLVMICSKLASRRTYQDLVEYCFGRRGFIAVSLFQFLFAFGGMCAYIIIVGDTLPIVLRQLVGIRAIEHSRILAFVLSRRSVIIWSAFLIILPLSLHRDVSKLARTSAFALIALLFILAAVVIEGPLESSRRRNSPGFDLIHPGIFQSIGVISFAFVCHHNSFIIYGSLEKPTLDRWASVTHWSTGISCALSLGMAIGGYAVFGEYTQGNILNNFSDSNIVISIARLCFAINMFTTFPLELFVCREVLEASFFPRQKTSRTLHAILTIILTAIPAAIGLITCNLGVLLELAGGFSASTLAFIFPPACFMYLSAGPWNDRKKILPMICLCGGVVVLLISTVMTVREAVLEHHKVKECNW